MLNDRFGDILFALLYPSKEEIRVMKKVAIAAIAMLVVVFGNIAFNFRHEIIGRIDGEQALTHGIAILLIVLMVGMPFLCTREIKKK